MCTMDRIFFPKNGRRNPIFFWENPAVDVLDCARRGPTGVGMVDGRTVVPSAWRHRRRRPAREDRADAFSCEADGEPGRDEGGPSPAPARGGTGLISQDCTGTRLRPARNNFRFRNVELDLFSGSFIIHSNENTFQWPLILLRYSPRD